MPPNGLLIRRRRLSPTKAPAMHGAIYLHLKTEGELQTRLKEVIWTSFGLFLVLFLIQTMWTLVETPRATVNFRASRRLWLGNHSRAART